MLIEPLHPTHMLALEEQGAEGAAPIMRRPGYLKALLANGPAFAGIVDEGVVAAVGMGEQNPGNFRCWAITDRKLASRHFLAVNKGIRAFFAESRAPRIETVVFIGNVAGHRWVTRILGFTPEGVMRRFHEGRDAMLYSRIQNG